MDSPCSCFLAVLTLLEQLSAHTVPFAIIHTQLHLPPHSVFTHLEISSMLFSGSSQCNQLLSAAASHPRSLPSFLGENTTRWSLFATM